MESNDNQELNKALVKACEKRDITTMNRLLQSGASVNARNEKGNTLLDIVIHQRRYASFNASWKFNVNDKEITQFLLDNKADINLANINYCDRNFLEMDLRSACIHRDTNQIKLLLKLGASIGYTYMDNDSVFYIQHYATPEITQLLTSYNLNPLNLALKNTCYQPYFFDSDKKEKQLIKVQQLLEAKAFVNCDNGWALFTAVKHNNNKLTQLLLGYKADVNLQDNKGRTPLWIGYGYKVISTLIAHKADINLLPHELSLDTHSYLSNVIKWELGEKRHSTIQLLTDNGAIVDNKLINFVKSTEGYECLTKQLKEAQIKQQKIIKLAFTLRVFIQPPDACDIILPVD